MKRLIYILPLMLLCACGKPAKSTANAESADVVYYVEVNDSVYITDSIFVVFKLAKSYLMNGDTLTVQSDTTYTLVDNHATPKCKKERIDGHLLAIDNYLVGKNGYVLCGHKDTVLDYHYGTQAKRYFAERAYNELLYQLYKRIIASDSISDEDLLNVMPQNPEQYGVFCSEYYPYNDRSLPIDSIALARAKYQPLFVDVYLIQGQWSDGAVSEILFEGYYETLRSYDSVYFDAAARRLLPRDLAETAIHGIDWEDDSFQIN